MKWYCNVLEGWNKHNLQILCCCILQSLCISLRFAGEGYIIIAKLSKTARNLEMNFFLKNKFSKNVLYLKCVMYLWCWSATCEKTEILTSQLVYSFGTKSCVLDAPKQFCGLKNCREERVCCCRSASLLSSTYPSCSFYPNICVSEWYYQKLI